MYQNKQIENNPKNKISVASCRVMKSRRQYSSLDNMSLS